MHPFLVSVCLYKCLWCGAVWPRAQCKWMERTSETLLCSVCFEHSYPWTVDYTLLCLNCSYKEALYHKFLLDFLKSVAAWYSSKYRPHEFFVDLLKLQVPTLFFNEGKDLENPDSLRFQFYGFLDGYYRSVQKQCSISDNMGPILVSTLCKNHLIGWSSRECVDSLCVCMDGTVIPISIFCSCNILPNSNTKFLDRSSNQHASK